MDLSCNLINLTNCLFSIEFEIVFDAFKKKCLDLKENKFMFFLCFTMFFIYQYKKYNFF
jgi:hypothetical protein